MKVKEMILISILVIFLTLCFECESLRCRTDDGPTEDDIKKIVRICMHKVGENETESDEYSDEDDSAEEGKKNDKTTTNRPNENRHNFNGFNYQSNYQTDTNPMYNNNWNSQNSQNNFGGFQRAYNGQFPNANQNQNQNQHHNQNQYPNQNGGYSNSFNSSSGSNGKNNQTEQDRACLVHCFFHELKLTNNEDFPEKRKMLQALTKDIREKEVREFYVVSIQECFHMVDNMENYNKCEVALTIVTCLTERARTNCEDFRDDIMIF